MKFFGNGIVWDATKNKILCKFENGEYETEDEYIIEKLIEYNYKSNGLIEEKPKRKYKKRNEV